MSIDQTLQSIADVLAANEQHMVPRDPNQPEPHWRDITGLPEPRPVPSPEDRMADARTDTPHTFRTYLDATDRDQLDARAATAEAERDEALQDRDEARQTAKDLYGTLKTIERERDTAVAVARSNKRHVAYLTAVIEALAAIEPHIHNGDATEDNCSPYCPGCRIRTAMNATPPSSVPSRRAQEEPVMVPLAGWGGGHSRVPARRAQEATEPPSSCPETVWDGPYAMRCGQGALAGVCGTHGRFRPAAEPTP